MPPQKQNHPRRTGHPPYGSRGKGDVEKVVGIQKIKSTLRQSRRLLNKDNLAADVRIATERRIKSLEHDLEVAETKRKEQSLATRYHKIKFFERQKVVRKIVQVKKEVEDTLIQSKLGELRTTLLELRVDLNYILHFPKMQKYISLFPSPSQSDDLPSTSNAKSDTDMKRAEIRSDIRTQMKDGRLPSEPELMERRDRLQEVKKHRDPSSSTTQTRIPKDKETNVRARPRPSRNQAEAQENMEVDDFFENDTENSEDEGSNESGGE